MAKVRLLYCALYLAGTQTPCAYIDVLCFSVHNCLDSLDIRQKAPVGGQMRVSDALSGMWTLAADRTTRQGYRLLSTSAALL